MRNADKKMIGYLMLYLIGCIIALLLLKVANDIGSYWINVSWAFAVWYGIESICLFDLIKEWKIERKKEVN